MSKNRFLNIGEVSGFDPEYDAAISLVLETLLASYARVAVQTIQDTEDSIVLRSTHIGAGIERHFFLLERGKEAKILRFGYKTDDRTEPIPRSSKMAKRTTIITDAHSHEFKKATRDTIVNENGGKVSRRFLEVLSEPDSKWELFYLDVSLTENDMSDKKDAAASENERFFAFFVYTGGLFNLLGFFARSKNLDTRSKKKITYLRHLMVDNISTEPFPVQHFNRETGHFDEVKEIEPRDIDPRSVEANTLPDSVNSSRIVHSVMFDGPDAYVLTFEAHEYTELVGEYIRDLLEMAGFTVNGTSMRFVPGPSIRKSASNSDYEKVYGSNEIERIVFTQYLCSGGRHQMTIAPRDSNIKRIIFGSNQNWDREMNNRDKTDLISAPGFGCLDNNICLRAYSGSENETWNTLMRVKDGWFNEMLGRSSDEIDSLLFDDSTFYRSYIGKNVSYADAVVHWFRQNFPSEFTPQVEDRIHSDVRNAYKRAFKPLLDTVIYPIASATQVSTGPHMGKSSSGYIRILQNGYSFEGFMGGRENRTPDTTKLVYLIDRSTDLKPQKVEATVFLQRVEGGSFLVLPKELIVPRETSDIEAINRRGFNGPTVEELRRAHDKAFYSARCPFGYVAHSFYKAVNFLGNRIEFFMPMKVERQAGNEVTLRGPDTCTAPHFSINGSDGSYGISSTSAAYFVNENSKSRQQRELLPIVKKVWERYIFTSAYIRSLFMRRKENSQASDVVALNRAYNKQMLFALELARYLRVNDPARQKAEEEAIKEREQYEPSGSDDSESSGEGESDESNGLDELEKKVRSATAASIYELLPHVANAVVSDLGRKVARLNELYPQVMINVYENCDSRYRAHRVELLYTLDSSFEPSESKLGEYTNLDYVNGFLLHQDFHIRPYQIGYLSHAQYIAMSASVYYKNEGVNELMTFMSDPDAEPDRESEFSTDWFVDKPDGSRARVLQLIRGGGSNSGSESLISNSIYPNISNVPIYNMDQNGSVIASTLCEALSVNSVMLYFLARSLHVKDQESTISFNFISGKPAQERTGGIQGNSSEGRGDKQSAPHSGRGWGDGINSAGSGPGNGTGNRTDNRTDNDGGAAAASAGPGRRADETRSTVRETLIETNIIRRIRAELTSTDYIWKGKRAEILIRQAAFNRKSLNDLAPSVRKDAQKQTWRETIFSFETQATPKITVSGKVPVIIEVGASSMEAKTAYISSLNQ